MAKDKKNSKELTTSKHREQTANAQNVGILQDARFQHLVGNPRFKNLAKVQRKVKIDKRFEGMFNDPKFQVKYTVDKYGRRVNKSNAEDLRKYYELETSSDSEAEQNEQQEEEKAILTEDNDALAIDEDEDVDAEDSLTLRKTLLDPNVDYARGEGRFISDSSDDESSTDDEVDAEANIDHIWGELDVEAERTEESTRRLAVCNMDWDRIRAVDLMVLLSSFLVPGGSILSIKIYPSEFGKARMAEEDLHGPQELVGKGKEVKATESLTQNGKPGKGLASFAGDSSDSENDLLKEQDSDDGEGDDYHMEKLRQYQLNRLRYYYAVVECDSVHTAEKIYKECDGIEYESSATRVDLRFIPDDTCFDDDKPTDVCEEMPDANNYKPRQFTTKALQQAKVDLTWDETSVERKELGDKLAKGKLDNVNDKDLRKLLAYSSEEDDNEDEQSEKRKASTEKLTISTTGEISTKTRKNKHDQVIEKYRALLAEINEQEQSEDNKKFEMECSWDIQVDAEKNDVDTNIGAELTPIEKVLKKRSEKNKRRKEERKKNKLIAKGIDPDTVNSDADSDLPEGVDMNDPYFAEEFANGDFMETKTNPKDKFKKRKKKDKSNDLSDEKEVNDLRLLLDDDDVENAGKQHFSLEKILQVEQETKSKRKRRKQLKKSRSAIAEDNVQAEDNFRININDDRFKAVYTSHLFNIDPSDSHFRKTKGMEQIIEEKLKRRHGATTETTAEEVETKRPKKQLENMILINNLKRQHESKQNQ